MQLQNSSDPLLNVRKQLSSYSLSKAHLRIRQQKERMEKYDEIQLQEMFEAEIQRSIGYSVLSTQYGDSSSTTKVRFSKSGKYCGTSGTSGVCTIWNTQNQLSVDFCVQKTLLKGETKVCDIDFHPNIGNIPKFAPNILTGNTLGEIQLWTFDEDLSEQKKINIKAHQDRINAVKFHEKGNIFLTASYDKTWSIYDSMKLKELSNQKGHQYPIHALSIHPDGALICTCDLERYGMVWDLRTGKGIYQVEADNAITCCDFHPNGYQLAVGGKSNIIDIFDIRRKSKLKSIPAHCKLISDLKYNETGTVLFSGSHDNKVKLWHGLNYLNINEQLEHSSKITSLSVSSSKVAVSMIDKKWAMWEADSCQKQQSIKEQP